MATVDVTTDPCNTGANSTSGAPYASERANPDAQSESAADVDSGPATDRVWENDDKCLVSPLEAVIEEERTRLMLADSVLGCLQIALDPEAVRVSPEPYFPEVLELARQFINKSVRQLEYEEIRRLLQSSVNCYK
jgi:hypothetical protein